MPGYDSQVIMAAGAFVSGASIELSADGPIKPPYAVYFQGGLTWQHAKFGILKSLQQCVKKGVVSGLFVSEIIASCRTVRKSAFSFYTEKKNYVNMIKAQGDKRACCPAFSWRGKWRANQMKVSKKKHS